MLASNNISAGAVVTQMEFDTNSPVPKILFSPIAAVDEIVLDSVQRQASNPAAINAVKMNVFQQDEGIVEPAAPRAEIVTSELPDIADIPSPVVRESTKRDMSDSDVPDVIKKWAKKK